MFARALLLATLVATFGLPSASALPSCADATDASATPLGMVYVGADGTLWQETNTQPGLQRVACEDENGRTQSADRRLV